MKRITVVAAVIENTGQFLCVQRAENKFEYISKKYEFPGGKVEDGETQEEALKREILEELSLDVAVAEKIITVDHSYPDFSISMHAYRCSSQNQDITMHEHIDYKWLELEDLDRLDWAAADIPIVEKLMEQ